jgi:hypothetical protein
LAFRGPSSGAVTGVLRRNADSRELLAALLTDPRNERFAQVLANRLWQQFLGFGLVDPVEDWENAAPSHPELLRWLGHELVTHDYDLKHLARLILTSRTYQRAATAEGSRVLKSRERLFESPARRRLTAEQLVDSLFAATGLEFDTEQLTMDPECRQVANDQGNFGRPLRAWEFAALSNERDRPRWPSRARKSSATSWPLSAGAKAAPNRGARAIMRPTFFNPRFSRMARSARDSRD